MRNRSPIWFSGSVNSIAMQKCDGRQELLIGAADVVSARVERLISSPESLQSSHVRQTKLTRHRVEDLNQSLSVIHQSRSQWSQARTAAYSRVPSEFLKPEGSLDRHGDFSDLSH
jgi:hypothetical protein